MKAMNKKRKKQGHSTSNKGTNGVAASEEKKGKNAVSAASCRLAQKGRFPPDDMLLQREDWTEFRDPNRISNKAGVPFEQLQRLL